jgi:hypothetical protein
LIDLLQNGDIFLTRHKMSARAAQRSFIRLKKCRFGEAGAKKSGATSAERMHVAPKSFIFRRRGVTAGAP